MRHVINIVWTLSWMYSLSLGTPLAVPTDFDSAGVDDGGRHLFLPPPQPPSRPPPPRQYPVMIAPPPSMQQPHVVLSDADDADATLEERAKRRDKDGEGANVTAAGGGRGHGRLSLEVEPAVSFERKKVPPRFRRTRGKKLVSHQLYRDSAAALSGVGGGGLYYPPHVKQQKHQRHHTSSPSSPPYPPHVAKALLREALNSMVVFGQRIIYAAKLILDRMRETGGGGGGGHHYEEPPPPPYKVKDPSSSSLHHPPSPHDVDGYGGPPGHPGHPPPSPPHHPGAPSSSERHFRASLERPASQARPGHYSLGPHQAVEGAGYPDVFRKKKRKHKGVNYEEVGKMRRKPSPPSSKGSKITRGVRRRKEAFSSGSVRVASQPSSSPSSMSLPELTNAERNSLFRSASRMADKLEKELGRSDKEDDDNEEEEEDEDEDEDEDSEEESDEYEEEKSEDDSAGSKKKKRKIGRRERKGSEEEDREDEETEDNSKKKTKKKKKSRRNKVRKRRTRRKKRPDLTHRLFLDYVPPVQPERVTGGGGSRSKRHVGYHDNRMLGRRHHHHGQQADEGIFERQYEYTNDWKEEEEEVEEEEERERDDDDDSEERHHGRGHGDGGEGSFLPKDKKTNRRKLKGDLLLESGPPTNHDNLALKKLHFRTQKKKVPKFSEPESTSTARRREWAVVEGGSSRGRFEPAQRQSLSGGRKEGRFSRLLRTRTGSTSPPRPPPPPRDDTDDDHHHRVGHEGRGRSGLSGKEDHPVMSHDEGPNPNKKDVMEEGDGT